MRNRPDPRMIALSLLGAAAACITPPKLDGDVGAVGTSGVEVAGSDESPYTTGAASTTGVAGSEGESTGADEPVGTTGAVPPPDVGSDVDDTGEPGELPPGYPVDQAFGDDVRELDLVGRWTVPWDAAGRDHVEIVVDEAGGFAWFERDADCGELGSASGRLWVEGSQIAFAVDTWDKPMPWDTVDATGETFAAPFRMRVGYTPMGGFLGFAAPPDLVGVAPWTGRAYARLDASAGPVGSWAAEAELWATPADEVNPVLVVRERREAFVPATSMAHVAGTRTWWWPEGPVTDDGDETTAPWVDETPGNVAGAAVIADVRHAYDGVGMITFTDETSLKLVAGSPCP